LIKSEQKKVLRPISTVVFLSLWFAVLGSSTAVRAAMVYNWTYYSSDLSMIVASGTLTADGSNVITSVTGTVSDAFGQDAIVGLISGDCCGGNGTTTDQLYIPPGKNNGGSGNDGVSFLDAYGFDVVTMNGIDVNIWARQVAPNDGCADSEGRGCGNDVAHYYGNGTFTINAQTSATPEPGSVLLAACGLAGLTLWKCRFSRFFKKIAA
jgi:hypothetical protein